jgi:hypothetical protein
MAANAYIEDVYTKNGIKLKMRVTKGTIYPGMILRLGHRNMKVKNIKIQRTDFSKAEEGELAEFDIENGDYNALTEASKSEVTFTEAPKKSLEEIKQEDPAIDYNELTVDEMKGVYHKKDKPKE